MTRLYGLFTLVAALLLLGGCASVPMASMEADAEAKAFTPAADKGALYIFRDEVFGAAIPMTVSVNGHVIGQTAANSYFWLELEPGRYRVESHTENVSTLPVTVATGENTYVWQEVKMGMWMARSLLQEVDAERGRQGVVDSKLVEADLPAGGIQPLNGDAPDSPGERLRELKQLRDEGVITGEEYERKKTELLDAL
ncbi:DUF2846 domain-containing protein [Guyparkeria hydrothermalis]|uniref:DUF2846 domain-containing protein n=1 Tax=Guyparkeria hydrothermalis TaxID=923 RepID=UPI002021929D|nr:DUF2846 domain-containing protein [Guyparkeria hydrothermalis]MCL7744577.1 DUF2846 domain-containing protein [Guyparkeria hydrothermalis]